MNRGAIFAALLLGLLSLAVRVAVAQSPAPADVPLMGSEASPGNAVATAPETGAAPLPQGFGGADNLYRILVIGDSLAGGFGAGVTRMLESDAQFEVVNRFNEVSGLARPEIYDWADAAPKILTSRPYEAVLVHVGVNDRQAIRIGADRFAFKSPEWEAAYKQRIAGLLAALKAQNVKVLWVALPPMADADFDADMQYLNGLYRAAVAEHGGAFVDLRRNFLAADGTYVDRGPDDTGEERKLRARDGITFLKQGNNRMGQLLAAFIKSEEAKSAPAASPQVVEAAPQTSPDPAPVTKPAGTPQFGQQGLDGAEIAFTPQIVPQQKKPDATQAAPQAENAPVRRVIVAATGSKAETLYKAGLSPDPEPGRFDDFGIVAPP